MVAIAREVPARHGASNSAARRPSIHLWYVYSWVLAQRLHLLVTFLLVPGKTNVLNQEGVVSSRDTNLCAAEKRLVFMLYAN